MMFQESVESVIWVRSLSCEGWPRSDVCVANDFLVPSLRLESQGVQIAGKRTQAGKAACLVWSSLSSHRTGFRYSEGKAKGATCISGSAHQFTDLFALFEKPHFVGHVDHRVQTHKCLPKSHPKVSDFGANHFRNGWSGCLQQVRKVSQGRFTSLIAPNDIYEGHCTMSQLLSPTGTKTCCRM